MECRGCHGIGHAQRDCPTAHPDLKGSGKGKDNGYGKGKGKGDGGKGWQGKGSWGKGKGTGGKSSAYSFNESPALSFVWGIRAVDDGVRAGRRGVVTVTITTTTEVTLGNWDGLHTLTLLHPLTIQTETTTAAERQQRRRHRRLPQLQYPAA